MFNDASQSEIDSKMQQAWTAFHVYRKMSLKQRAAFMKAIAIELEACGDELIQTAKSLNTKTIILAKNFHSIKEAEELQKKLPCGLKVWNIGK